MTRTGVKSLKSHLLILASSSPRRRELIQMLGLPVRYMTSGADEIFPQQLTPAEIVKYLSIKKAEHVREQVQLRHLDGIIVGADTIVVYHDRILGKPRSKEEACEMLQSLQGQAHDVFSGIACVDAKSGRTVSSFRRTRVWMRKLTEQQIEAYVASGEPMDKAGAYGIQGKGALLIDRIEGDYFNVVGLSIVLLSEMLRDFGIEVLR